MVRKYTSKPGARTYGSYKEENLQSALSDVKAGTVRTICIHPSL